MRLNPRLLVLSGPEDGYEYSIEGKEITLGRDKQNTIQLDWDRYVSGQHARIVDIGGLYWFEDLGSSNGAFVEFVSDYKHQLTSNARTILFNGMRVCLGRYAGFEVVGIVNGISEVKLHGKPMSRQRVQFLGLTVAQRNHYREQIVKLEKELFDARDIGAIHCTLRKISTICIELDQFYTPLDSSKKSSTQDKSMSSVENLLPPLPEKLPKSGDPRKLTTPDDITISGATSNSG